MGRAVGYLMLGWLLAAAAGVYGQADTAFVQRRDWLTGQREMLPDWLLEAPSEGRFIAVSDPGLKPEVARGQARLWLLFCAG